MAPASARLFLPLILIAGSLAGCIHSAEPMSTGLGSDAQVQAAAPSLLPGNGTADQSEPPAAEDGIASNLSTSHQRRLYAFAGHVTGVSLPDPDGSGGLVETVGAARYDRFQAPSGILQLDFQLFHLFGTGSARIDVLDAEGSLVHRTFTVTMVGDPVGVVSLHHDPLPPTPAKAGLYQVRYYVAGGFDVDFRVNATVQGMAPVTPQWSVTPRPHTDLVVFSGALLAPDPVWAESRHCPAYVNLYGDVTQHVTWEGFSFGPGALDGWGYRLDVPGMVADFKAVADSGAEPQHASLALEKSGVVPHGAHGVAVCSTFAVNTRFQLILTPPDALVLKGKILAPHLEYYEHGTCGSVSPSTHEDTKALDMAEFALSKDYTGWTYDFDVEGLYSNLGGSSRTGMVGPGYDRVSVCSPSQAAVDFVLTLLPPA